MEQFKSEFEKSKISKKKSKDSATKDTEGRPLVLSEKGYQPKNKDPRKAPKSNSPQPPFIRSISSPTTGGEKPKKTIAKPAQS